MLSVVIPTYKNKAMFLKNLKNNLNFLSDCEIIVVNDDPEESLKKELKQIPKLILVENKKNFGFSQAVNIGVSKASYPYIMLLNNDVLLNSKNYLRALDYFKEDISLFAVSFAQKEERNKIVGRNKIFWHKGLFNHKGNDLIEKGINAWAEGGASIIDKSKFLKLGGFDSLYSPFYWEDIDLSYRAWKSGYKIIFAPEIIVTHHHESTIKRFFDQQSIKKIAFRNQFIFIWKNIDDSKLFFEHIFFLLPNVISLLIKGELAVIKGLINALFKITKICQQKNALKNKYLKKDTEILQLFNPPS